MANYKMSENYNFSDYCFPHGTVNGVSVPFFTTPEYRAEMRTKFKVRPESDIFIVTYPKSGTTWMQSILREMLYSNDTPEFSNMKLTNRIPWTDNPYEFLLDELDKFPSPRAFKCHHYSPVEMDDLFFKGSRKPRIIYVMRDPRDVSVSLYHHSKKTNLSHFFKDATFDEFHKKVTRDKEVAIYGLWEQHIDNWLSKRDEYDILVVKYEDLIEDAAREIERVAKFLDLELPSTTFQDIARKTSFSSATKKDLFNDDTGVYNSLLRKGVVGDWVNNFTDMEEADNMNRIAQDTYKKHGV